MCLDAAFSLAVELEEKWNADMNINQLLFRVFTFIFIIIVIIQSMIQKLSQKQRKNKKTTYTL